LLKATKYELKIKISAKIVEELAERHESSDRKRRN
jgi:hypothetical protein